MSSNDGMLENVLVICVCFFIVLVPCAMIASVMPLEYPLHKILIGFATTFSVIGGMALYMLKS
jgi:hypothetical protein